MRSNPKALFGAEILHVWSIGVTPCTDGRLQAFFAIDDTKAMIILEVVEEEGREMAVGLGEYCLDEDRLWANVAFAVRDALQNRSIGTDLLAFLIHVARRQGLVGLTAEVLKENERVLRVFEKMGMAIERVSADESWDLRLRVSFGNRSSRHGARG